jgi:hypothetical protein
LSGREILGDGPVAKEAGVGHGAGGQVGYERAAGPDSEDGCDGTVIGSPGQSRVSEEGRGDLVEALDGRAHAGPFSPNAGKVAPPGGGEVARKCGEVVGDTAAEDVGTADGRDN